MRRRAGHVVKRRATAALGGTSRLALESGHANAAHVRMNRDDIVQTISVLANVGVLAGIVFLAIEIRQNTSAQFADSRQAVLSASREEIILTIEDPGLVLALTNSEPLTPEENIRVDGLLSVILRAREFAWLQHSDGVIDDAQWSTEFKVLSAFFDSSRARLWWEAVGRSYFSDEFVGFIDAEILVNPATDQVLPVLADWSSPR